VKGIPYQHIILLETRPVPSAAQPLSAGSGVGPAIPIIAPFLANHAGFRAVEPLFAGAGVCGPAPQDQITCLSRLPVTLDNLKE
jgi:hypothetical protein